MDRKAHKTKLYRILVLALSILAGAAGTRGQTSTVHDSCDSYLKLRKPQFRIVRKQRTTLKPGLELFVSVPPRDADRSGLLAVVCYLGQEFATETALFVWILDNQKAAGRYNPQGEGNDRETASAFRGLYGFNRDDGGSQSFEWKPDPDKPQLLVHIDLGPPPRKPVGVPKLG